MEHKTVLESCNFLRDYFNYEIEYVKLKDGGIVDLQDLRNKIKNNTLMVTIMALNNEIGVT